MLAVLGFVMAFSLSQATTPPGSWFGFGDSYTQTQFNYTLAQPSVSNPLGNPPLPGITPCGTAPNWLVWATTRYNSSVDFAYNFAWGGATISDAVVPPSSADIYTLVEQVDEFQTGYAGTVGSAGVVWHPHDTLFATFIGINDIGNSYNFTKSTADTSRLHKQLMDAYFYQMQRLYELGARNFLFLNVPPTDRSPLIISRGAHDQQAYAAAVKDYNVLLASRISLFTRTRPKVRTWSVNTHAIVSVLLDHPTHFGFGDATSFGSGDEFLWCNNYHISPAAHRYIALAVQRELNATGLL